MAIIATAPQNDTDFTPAPEGTHQAVCVDVIDLGWVENEWQGKVRYLHMIRFVWEIDEETEDGKRMLVYSRRFNLTLGKNAALRQFLEAWRGKKFTEEELRGWDVEKVLGANCQLSVVHTEKDGTTYANVSAILPLGKKQQKMEPSGSYVRRCERDDWKAPDPNPPTQNAPSGDGAATRQPELAAPEAGDDDGLPF